MLQEIFNVHLCVTFHLVYGLVFPLYRPFNRLYLYHSLRLVTYFHIRLFTSVCCASTCLLMTPAANPPFISLSFLPLYPFIYTSRIPIYFPCTFLPGRFSIHHSVPEKKHFFSATFPAKWKIGIRKQVH